MGPLKVTSTSVKDSGTGQGGGTARVVVALVSLQNVSGQPVTEAPTTQVKNTHGVVLEATMPTATVDFSIQPGERKQVRLTFGVSGTPFELSVGMTGDNIEFPESGEWSLTQ